MKKSGFKLILISIIIGLLCVAVIVLSVFMYVQANRTDSVDVDITEGDEEDVSKVDENMLTAAISDQPAYKQFELENFKSSYKTEDDKDESESIKTESESFYGVDTAMEAAPPAIEEIQDDSDYIIPDSDARILNEEDLEELSSKELTYARNEIYARHGRIFKSSELQEYFSSKDWYEPDEGFDDNDLRGTEKKNAEFIAKYQKDHDMTYRVS